MDPKLVKYVGFTIFISAELVDDFARMTSGKICDPKVGWLGCTHTYTKRHNASVSLPGLLPAVNVISDVSVEEKGKLSELG